MSTPAANTHFVNDAHIAPSGIGRASNEVVPGQCAKPTWMIVAKWFWRAADLQLVTR
jgi:hypothetical protein